MFGTRNFRCLPTVAEAWASLTDSDRDILFWFLLADGISEVAINYVFANIFDEAKKNPAVGIGRALDITVNLVSIRRFNPRRLDAACHDISDLAPLTRKVRSAKVFMTVPQHPLFVQRAESLHHLVNANLWARAANLYVSHDNDLIDIAFSVAKTQQEVVAQRLGATQRLIRPIKAALNRANGPSR